MRAEDLEHPDELRVDLDPVPGVAWSQIRDVAIVTAEVLELGLVGWPKTSGSRGIHVYARIERRWTFAEVRRAALALAREVERRAPDLATQQVVEGGAPRRVPRLQPEREGPHDRVRVLGPADAGRAGLDAAAVGRGRRLRARRVHDRHRAGAFAELGDPAAGIDEAAGSLDALLELAAQHEAAGFGDAPWPPQYAKQEGEPARVQPSKRQPGTPEKEGIVPPPAPGKKTGPTGRRRTTAPLIEIARPRREARRCRGSTGGGATP